MLTLFGENWYLASEVATLLDVNVQTIYRWCKEGKWKGVAKKKGLEWIIPERCVRAITE